MNCLAIFTFLVYVANTTSAVTKTIKTEDKYPLINNLIVKVKEAVWNDDEKVCVEDTLKMLYGIKNRTLWATWAWDSMQSPAGVLYGSDHHLGNYDQCLNAPWTKPVLQYCLVDVNSEEPNLPREFDPYDDTQEYLKSLTKYGRSLNKQTFGVCFPSSCKPASTAKVYSLLHQLTYLVEGNVTVDPRDCQVAGETKPSSVKFSVFWGTIAGLLLVVAISTCYDFFGNKNPKLELVTKPFSFKSNFQELLKVNKDDIKVMYGMRFLTSATVVFMHESSFTFAMPLSNAMDIDWRTNSWYGQILLHSDMVVDTFVVMSGLLLARSLFSGPNKNLLVSLLKRYIRLIGPFAIITFYLIASVYETGDGPIWARTISKEADACEENWWKNFLMINNDMRTVCHTVSWYIACDYQLAVLSTLLFYVYRRNSKIGLTAFFAVGTVLTVKFGWVIYANNMSILPFENAMVFTDFRKHLILLNEMYFNIESRIGAYFVGVIMGYILTVYKPKNNRNLMNKTTSAGLLLSSLATLLFVFCIAYLYSLKSYNAVEAGVIVALHRAIWAMAICGIIAVAEYGSSNYVTEFLGLSIFGPLSKLSYGIYLLHPIFIEKNLASTRTPIEYNLYTITVNSLGALNMSCAASFVIYMIIEAPLIKISNDLFTERKENLKVTNENVNNGHTKCKDL